MSCPKEGEKFVMLTILPSKMCLFHQLDYTDSPPIRSLCANHPHFSKPGPDGSKTSVTAAILDDMEFLQVLNT